MESSTWICLVFPQNWEIVVEVLDEGRFAAASLRLSASPP